ncbi:MAG: TRAM domain-containing protein, partial [Desulfohalobiaceae bacterium]|nr:TRAM domain-containing protein [Desulfohalobiaceae bacterium]
MKIEPLVQVEKLIWRGRGLSRLDSGKVVIIEPGVFPGERVKIKITQEKKDYLRAVCTKIIEPLPGRRPHPCPHSDACGGCLFGVIPNRMQLHLKHDLLAAELFRALPQYSSSINQVPIEVFPSPRGWRYRWRGRIHVHASRPHFTKMGSHELVPLKDCLLLARPLGQGLGEICQRLPEGKHTVAAGPRDGRPVSDSEDEIVRLPFPKYQLQLKVSARSFFQANWQLNQDLAAFVTSSLSGFGRVADLYAGAGNFALPLATVNDRVLALEYESGAVESCRQSALQAGLDNLRVERLDLSDFLPDNLLSDFAPKSLVLDPPRTGGGKKGLESLRRLD